MVYMQSRRRRRDAIAHAAEDSWQHFQLYLHGCQVFAEDEATSTALQRHLVRTTAASLMDWLLRYQVSSLSLVRDGIRLLHNQGWTTLSQYSLFCQLSSWALADHTQLLHCSLQSSQVLFVAWPTHAMSSSLQ